MKNETTFADAMLEFLRPLGAPGGFRHRRGLRLSEIPPPLVKQQQHPVITPTPVIPAQAGISADSWTKTKISVMR